MQAEWPPAKSWRSSTVRIQYGKMGSVAVNGVIKPTYPARQLDAGPRCNPMRVIQTIATGCFWALTGLMAVACFGAGENALMTRRRFWVYFLLFLFNVIAYTDRVNISVAGKPIADELGLSPIALGYLFSSFLWAYVLMMLPGGRLIECSTTVSTRASAGRALKLGDAAAAEAAMRRHLQEIETVVLKKL